MNPKVLVVVVVLLVVLLAVSVGLGASQEEGPLPASTPSLAEKLGKLFVREKRLVVQDISAASPSGCRAQLGQGAIILVQGESCTLIIGSSSATVRVLPLELVQGAQARVMLDPNGDKGLTSDQTLDVKKSSAELRFFKEGGTLEITCEQGGTDGTCRLKTK